MSDEGSSVVLPPRTYVRFTRRSGTRHRWAGEPHDQALRRRGPRRTRRRDAGGVRVARTPLRGGRRDRQMADRRAVVVRRTRPRVLAGRGAWRRGLGSLFRSPAGPLAHGTAMGLTYRCPPAGPFGYYVQSGAHTEA